MTCQPPVAAARATSVLMHATVYAGPLLVSGPTTWDADQALDQLYAAHWRSLVRLAVLLVHDVSLAEVTGQLAAIAPEVDERNRHFRVEVRVANADNALLSGMYATARLVVATADKALTLPREAVMTREGQRMVLKVTDGKVSAVPVTEGLGDGRIIQILSGLSAGDQVLADARRQLPNDARVKAVLR